MKTYSHLAGAKRIPSEYEIATTGLLYYPKRGFEVSTPLSAWYEQHQSRSPLVAKDWDAFVDPRETTYTKYTELARRREEYVERLFGLIEETQYDRGLSPDWRRAVGRALSAVRYPLHGLQMIAAYVGQMAPSGRVTIVAAFQAADELRRIQHVAYRMAQLSALDPDVGNRGREDWENLREWQPLRQTVERCLVTYDWAEALVALNVCLKPAVDDVLLGELSTIAASRGDHIFSQILGSLQEDAAWQREWTIALLELALRETESNHDVLARWVAKWMPPSLEASAGMLRAFSQERHGADPPRNHRPEILARLRLEHAVP